MLVHVGLLCTSNQWLGTVLPQDFALGKVGSEHKMMNIVTAVPSAWYFSFAVIMSEINPTSTDDMSACLFPDEGFWIAVCELVESKTVWYYIRSWNQRAYICRRQQHKFEIAEYNNNMDSIRLSMTHSNLKTLTKLFLHMSWRTDTAVTPSSSQRSMQRVYWKFSALHWFFLCCFGFLKTWKRSRPFGPELNDCELELASESIYMLLANRTFSTPDTFQVQILIEIYDKTRVYRW